MTNPYDMSAQNGQYYPYYQYNNRSSVLSTAAVGAGIGFVGGTVVTAGIDYFKNRKPVNSNGEVSENFAKQVLDRIIKKDYVFKGKEFFKQKLNVLKKLDEISTPEKFKKLMEKNRKYCSSLCDGISLESMCRTVTKENLKEKISVIKSRIKASFSSELQNIKHCVALCWDKENKEFVKPKNIDNKLFDIIKNTKNDIQWSKAFKYGGITAGILGALTLGLAVYSRTQQNNMQ